MIVLDLFVERDPKQERTVVPMVLLELLLIVLQFGEKKQGIAIIFVVSF